MKHKSLKVTALATAMALSMSAVALAAKPVPGGGGGTGATPEEQAANGDTTISIFQTANTVAQVSYTVPLYVTMGVTANDDAVKVPTNYTLINQTKDKEGKTVDIGVTNMSFEKLSNNGFKTVAPSSTAITDANEISLKINGAAMPALATKGTSPVTLTGSQFMDTQNTSQPAKIGADPFNMPIEGKVASTARTDTQTAAQFRVKYTVSLLSTTGQSLGDVYAGDDHTQAGLTDWHVDTN